MFKHPLPAPFKVIESYVNYNVKVEFEKMPQGWSSVSWHYKKNSDQGTFIRLTNAGDKVHPHPLVYLDKVPPPLLDFIKEFLKRNCSI